MEQPKIQLQLVNYVIAILFCYEFSQSALYTISHEPTNASSCRLFERFLTQ